MLQAVSKGAGEIACHEVPVPEIRDNQLLLQIKRIGICGSDMQILHGKHAYMTFPLVQGHEVSARVAKVGGAVSGFSEGDKVTVEPLVTCGTCRPCRDGHYNVCENLGVIGVHEDGMATEYYAIDADKVLKLDPKTSYDRGALVEPTAVASAAIRRAGGVEGKKVAVLGAGVIGNLVAQVAKSSGADSVMITDVQETRLERATRCGIDYAANMVKTDLDTAVAAHFGPEKADVILDCAGVKTTIEQALSAARGGTSIVVVANFKEAIPLEIQKLQRREVDLVGVMVYRRLDFERAVDLIDSGKINSDELITHHFPLCEFEEAFQFIDEHQREVIKVLLTANEE
ncbi:MAG: alcohol dehydrogenase catalytic domain-containing protein [Spirochaetia bacterium]